MKGGFVTALCALAPLAMAQWAPTIFWSLESSVCSRDLVEDDVCSFWNLFSEPRQIDHHSELTSYQVVSGSTTAAPWSSKFTPLSSNWMTHSVDIHEELPANSFMLVTLRYFRESGSEQWRAELSTESSFLVDRIRRWDTSVEVRAIIYHYIP